MPRATRRPAAAPQNAGPSFEIVPEIQSLLDTQTDEEIAILRQQLQDAGGALQPITVGRLQQDGRRILLDGHTRLRLTQELGLPTPAAIDIHVQDMAAARLWVISHQLGRRNLSDVQRRHYLGLYYLEQNVERGGATGDRENTLERVARETGTSESTVARAARRVRNVQTATADNPEVRRRVMVGDVALTDGQARQWAEADEERRRSVTQMIAAGSTFDRAWHATTPRPQTVAAPAPAAPVRLGAVTPTESQRTDPAQIAQIIQDGVAMTRQWVQGARRLRAELETLTIVPSGITLGSVHSELDGLLERVITEVKNRQPGGPCPTCEGTSQSDNGGRCMSCDGRGWLDVQALAIRQRNAG